MKTWFTSLLLLILCTASAQTVNYSNPILAGFYPDPSICRAGDDYYLVNSTFAYFPGLPIFHSKDLVNWKQIGHALDRPDQLKLDGAGVSGGLYAPGITYHKGKFYIVCTNVSDIGNFVITADNPAGPWSNPVKLPNMPGIDPSIFFDDDGKGYIIWHSDAPDNKPTYDGHRTIRLVRFDEKTLTVSGEPKILVNGGTDITKKPRWIEGPHLFKKDGWYYLMAAEGGTEINHSEVIFRSKNVDGPYIPYENNPILTQRYLEDNRENKVTSTGHADLVQLKDGRWYAVFLGCRPYEGNHYNTGRETFMAPVFWRDGWPHITQGTEEVKPVYPVPFPQTTKVVNNPYNNPVKFTDEFNNRKLDFRYIFLRTPREQWYSLTEKPGDLMIKLRPETVSEKTQASFIGFRQQSNFCNATTSIRFTANNSNEKAGISFFQNETHHYYLCVSKDGNKPVVQVFQSGKDSLIKLDQQVLPAGATAIDLMVISNGRNMSFHYKTGSKWIHLDKADSEGKFISTETAGGFVGVIIGMYATSSGKVSTNKAWFKNISYEDVPVY